MTYTPGVDASRYDNEVDWRKVYAAGYRFAVLRATVGDYYTDPRFYVNWTSAKEAGLLVSAYHVIVATKYADKQIAWFANTMGDRKTDFPIVFDIERKDIDSKKGNAANIRECISNLAKVDSRKPIIYTAKYYWQDYVEASTEWANYDLWVACYSSKPYLPNSWTSWKIWQYAETGKVPGMGAASDVNWFNGSYEDLVNYCGGTAPVVELPTSNLNAQVVVNKLNIRSGPSTDYQKLGSMAKGTTVNVKNIDGTDTWIQFDSGKWAACKIGSQQYLNPVAGSPFKVRSMVDRLNIRSGPGTSYKSLGKLYTGDEVNVIGISGKDAWIQYDEGKWAAFTHGTQNYLQLA